MSTMTNNSSEPVARRLVEGLKCNLDLYNEYIESDEGQDIFIMAALCESRIVYLKNVRAGWYGPIPQADLSLAMCSEECLRSDELHKKAMSLSRCTCAQVSADTIVRHDFCLENSARLLCTHLSECGHWGCQLEDFNCLRYEWDHLYPCAGSCVAINAGVVVLALTASCKDSDLPVDVSFPVAAEDLTLGSKTAELGLDTTASLYCKLTLEGIVGETQVADWLSWKLTRASEYRERGNEAFKQESYSTATRLYKRALTWLEPPLAGSDAALDAKIEYSDEELQQVNPIAVACYANMATCYSKLLEDGDVDRCIAAASSALKLDDTHVKARYRRSQAYVASKEFHLAVTDLLKLSELEPDNKLFRSALTRAQVAKTQLRKKQQSAFANLFDK
ncbi:hypothetical protein PInf_023161 [Phytophthora infestans]|nr:hypothetical protein PInf_023161 [Phytophthora infestans]